MADISHYSQINDRHLFILNWILSASRIYYIDVFIFFLNSSLYNFSNKFNLYRDLYRNL